MRNILLFLFLASIAFDTFAQGEPPLRVSGQGGGPKLISVEMAVPNRQVTRLSSSKSLIETGNNNLLENPSFQHQTTATGWTVTGVTASDETSDIDSGAKAIKFVTSSDTGSLRQDSTLNINSLADGAYGSLRVRAKNSANDSQVCFRQAGNNSKCMALLTDNKWHTYHFPSVLFGGTSNGVGFEWDNSTGTTIIGSAVLQLDNPVVQVAQAEIVGTARLNGSAVCAFFTTSTSFVGFAASPDCGAQSTTGSISSPSTKKLAFNANLKSGKYLISHNVSFLNTTTSATTTCRLKAGSVVSSEFHNFTRNGSNDPYINYMEFNLNLAEQYNGEVELECKVSSGTFSSAIGNATLFSEFKVIYYPPPTEVIASRCENPIDCETVFSAKVDGTVSPSTVSDENVDWLNGNCTRPSTGTFVCNFNNGVFTTAPNCIADLREQGMNCIPTNTTTSSTTILCRNGAVNPMNGLLTLSCQRTGEDYKKAKINYQLAQLKASNVDGGVDFGLGRKMISGYATFGGATEPSNCTSSPCTKYQSNGDLADSITLTRGSAGQYVVTVSGLKPNRYLTCHHECYSVGVARGFPRVNVSQYKSNGSGVSAYALSCRADNASSDLDAMFSVYCTAEAP